jgi:hypothetical protein
MQPLDLLVAGGEQHAFEQRRPYAAALPCPFDAQGHLGFTCKTLDERIGHGAAESIAPTFCIEARGGDTFR